MIVSRVVSTFGSPSFQVVIAVSRGHWRLSWLLPPISPPLCKRVSVCPDLCLVPSSAPFTQLALVHRHFNPTSSLSSNATAFQPHRCIPNPLQFGFAVITTVIAVC